ncbi:MAG: hypothetical protein AAFR64_07355 [Pseudomonadota bacterium]
MHKRFANIGQKLAKPLSAGRAKTVRSRRLAGFAVLGLFVIMAVAWFDGGQEPIHTIVQPVDMPPVGEGT